MKKNVLVTGSTGFIGSHLLDRISKDDYNIFALMRYVTGRYIHGEEVNKVFCDIKDYFSIKKVIKEINPEVVVHLASLSAVSYSYDHPQEVLDTNLLGSVNLAEACLRECRNLEKFIFASTSETYGNHGEYDFPLTEESKQYPNSPYSVSKRAFEDYLKYMGKAYEFPFVIARPFNTYGRKDNCHFVVERIITQMLTKDKITLGDPDAIRDWLYVDDHVNAYLTLMKLECIGETFNFCSGEATSIRDMCTTISNKLNWNGKIEWNSIPKRPYDIAKLVGDNKKAKILLDWNPIINLSEGLTRSIDWWKHK